MTTETKKTPLGATLSLELRLDPDLWGELKSQGYSDEDIKTLIEKAITFADINKAPIFDIDSVSLVKYY